MGSRGLRSFRVIGTSRNEVPKKKSRAVSPAQKLCRPYFPIILNLIKRATLLVRVRAPPETWTTSLSTDSLSHDW